MCAHKPPCTPVCAFPVCLWDSSLPAFSPKCICPNAATPDQEVLSYFTCHDIRFCGIERKELAVTWVSFFLFFPLLFLLTPPSIQPTPFHQLLSYPKCVVLARQPLVQSWVEKVWGLGKAKQIHLCSHLGRWQDDQQGRPSVTKSKISAETFHCMKPPSATAILVGARSCVRAVVAVPKLPVRCCGLPREWHHPTVGQESGALRGTSQASPLSCIPQVAMTRRCCSTNTWGSGLWICNIQKYQTPIEGEE